MQDMQLVCAEGLHFCAFLYSIVHKYSKYKWKNYFSERKGDEGM